MNPSPSVFSLLFYALFLYSFLALGNAGTASDLVPKPYPPDRYDPIGKKSPFTLSSIASTEKAGFTENLALAGIIKVNGTYFAAVIDKTTLKRELISDKANAQGLKLVQADSSDDLSKVIVTLEKNGERSILRYDLNFLKSNAAQASGNPVPGLPQANTANPSPAPNRGGPPPTVRIPRSRVIPSAPGGQPPSVKPNPAQNVPALNNP